MTYCVLHLSKKKSFRFVGTHKPDGWSVGRLVDWLYFGRKPEKKPSTNFCNLHRKRGLTMWLVCTSTTNTYHGRYVFGWVERVSCSVLSTHTHTPFMISSIWVRKPLLFGCPKCECLWANERSGRVGCMRGEKQNHKKNFRFKLLQRTILFFFLRDDYLHLMFQKRDPILIVVSWWSPSTGSKKTKRA